MTFGSANTDVAAILVGGLGSRLRSIISDVPKPLAPINGKPFLHLLLSLLSQYGIKKIVLLTGYMHEKIYQSCGDGRQFDVEITYSEENERLGTGGAIRFAKNHLTSQSHFLLLNGDTFFDGSLIEFINKPLDSMGMIGVCHVEDASRFGSLKINSDWQIEAFQEKSNNKNVYVNTGIYKLSTDILNFIPDRMCSLEQEIFPTLIEQGYRLEAFPLDGNFHDIGTPESYSTFQKLII